MSTGKHRTTWTADRFRDDLLRVALVASGKRVDLTTGYRQVNARDELRGTLSNTVCNASNYTKRAQPYLLGSDMSDVLDKTADAILAAGYRKPRTITTTEELDALPDGSVILDPIGVSLHKSAFAGWRASNGAKEITSEMLEQEAFPATVLHEGSAK